MGLQVIGLVSGGKDSFFNLAHCVAQGHRIVALANLHEGEDDDEDGAHEEEAGGGEAGGREDLNSFMYQTVGHEMVPLYGEATGLPLYRERIVGGAVQQEREYAYVGGGQADGDEEETESMTRLLRRILAAHPAANAVSAGAILSTYQRTRVESVAARLGLTVLAYLWQLPGQPGYALGSGNSGNSGKDGISGDSGGSGDAYLAAVGAAGLDARIVKVASGGLDEQALWTDVGSAAGRMRLGRAVQRFGSGSTAEAAAMLLGEGGEYETVVVAGPRAVFGRGRVAVPADGRKVVQEGGGSAFLRLRGAACVPRSEEETDQAVVRVPGLLDRRFVRVWERMKEEEVIEAVEAEAETEAKDVAAETKTTETIMATTITTAPALSTWCILPATDCRQSVEAAAQSVVDQVRARLQGRLATQAVARTVLLLRRMVDFAAVNSVYARLFGDDGLPNPPARVAVACGTALPAGVDVAVHLGVVGDREDPGARHGLHVQSRSYWAPANIGPYSQAVSVDQGAYRLVAVAGQIPLVPATMALPGATEEAEVAADGAGTVVPLSGTMPTPRQTAAAAASLTFQTVLALQHLWRIGTAVGVQWWANAVAYVPRQDTAAAPTCETTAVLVGRAWRAAHLWEEGDEDEDEKGEDEDSDAESGPDLWDRHFDARTFRPGGCSDDAALGLPDWTAVAGGTRPRPRPRPIPPVFLAEIAALPRDAPVEWHAHAGLSGVVAGRIQQVATADGVQTLCGGQVVQTVQTWPWGTAVPLDDMVGAQVVYVDAAQQLPAGAWTAAPVVPCFSLWDGGGRQLGGVVVR